MKRLLFLLFSGALAALVMAVFVRDMVGGEWFGYQRAFFATLDKKERRGQSYGIRQILIPQLNRADRCTSCHLAIDRPALALAQQPFTAHPGDYLKTHPVEQFGCVSCHGGQGQATDARAAHGEVQHWEQPLLRGAYVQASCGRCHGDVASIKAEAPLLAKGRQLFRENGCMGCHALHGVGQTISVELGDIATKPLQQLDFTFVEGPHTLAAWLDEHFKNPQQITPGFRQDELPPGEEEIFPSSMPNYGFTDEEARALTIYMLSLTDEKLPSNYVVPALPDTTPVFASPVAAGREVFQRFGCAGCHGADGRGGRANWNYLHGQQVPALTFVKAGYTKEQLKQFIQHGKQPVDRLDPHRPVPPLYMPSWREKIRGDDLDHLADYLLSLAPAGVAFPQPSPSEVHSP